MMRSATRLASFLAGGALALTAWIVFAASSDLREGRSLAVPHDQMWSGATSASEDSLSLLTHGSWLCANAECRYRALSGGAPFRSAASQDCTLCQKALVQSHPENLLFQDE